jgi:DNA-3-methyladenine glycosylase I
LFEKLSLEGAQSGLSWLTILRKRDAYRRTFHNFDIDAVAAMTDDDVEMILAQEVNSDPSEIIVRHRGKIQAVINNAKSIQQMRQDAEGPGKNSPHGVFDHFLWSFVNDQPIVNNEWDGKDLKTLPSKTDESEAMSKALKKVGFKFVGPTTCYSLMQSCGMVIDHPVDSPEWKAAIARLKKRKAGYQMR